MSTLNDVWWAREIVRTATFGELGRICAELSDSSLAELHDGLTAIRETVRAEWRSRHEGEPEVTYTTGAS